MFRDSNFNNIGHYSLASYKQRPHIPAESCRQRQMMTVNVTSRLPGTSLQTHTYIHAYISFGLVFVEGGVGVYKPLSPARKLCLLCSVGSLLRCQIGFGTYPEKIDSKYCMLRVAEYLQNPNLLHITKHCHIVSQYRGELRVGRQDSIPDRDSILRLLHNDHTGSSSLSLFPWEEILVFMVIYSVRFRGLLRDAFQNRRYTASDSMIDESLTSKDLEGSGSGLLQAISRFLPCGTEGNYEIPVPEPRFKPSTSRT
jgi:hypothetical protein